MHGTVKDTICDPITGQCECKDKEKGLIVGRQCDKCKYGYCGYPMCERKFLFIFIIELHRH